MTYNYNNRQMLVVNNKIVLYERGHYCKTIKECCSNEAAQKELEIIATTLYLQPWRDVAHCFGLNNTPLQEKVECEKLG